ncbi:MAG: type II toxin-antitoxin system HigB family toxin [Sulfuritalea sp.]|nr:type II toxin-antitoxin system HigB family toxin [Sulfuritalea sp.]
MASYIPLCEPPGPALVGDLAVFDIGGNKYRLIAYIRFEKQIVYIKAVLTHRGYDKGAWKS